MRRTITELTSVNAEWDRKRAGIQILRKVDRAQNEGGEGYRSYEDAVERLASQFLPQVTALTEAIFAAEWTAEVTAERRAAWNTEIGKLGVKVQHAQVRALIARLGYSHNDIGRAKALHGIK